VEKSGKRVGDKSGSLAALFGVYGLFGTGADVICIASNKIK
jgi:hypothetical protein